MDSTKLKEIIKMANEAVTGLDGDLKKIAFQTTLDKLLAQNIEPAFDASKITRKGKVRKTKKSKESGTSARKSEDDTTVKEILGKINRTKYHKITSLDSALDRALYLLLVVRDDLKIDGLNPTQIANLLREVFRIKATKNAVSMALGKDSKYTHRTPVVINGAKAYVYKIMHEGEKYIKEKIAIDK
ncbi:MAG: hypothetical protein UT90_C0014G0012 [Parcubacteria group bacterium GW2011_GWA1_40_21]|nr:MAG: hypothetical protein UT80_C0013G0010 [Parcubacteria group bacterium GW2011_GWC1_40_13]KKR53127.1 MAG: hypothetical protein UT90_C0014G0012 [Parcubacteria group bacterium GW2011_GWA1_40_21]